MKMHLYSTGSEQAVFKKRKPKQNFPYYAEAVKHTSRA